MWKIEINRQQRLVELALETAHFKGAHIQPLWVTRARPFVLFTFRVIEYGTARHAPILVKSVAKTRFECALLAGWEFHFIRI
jgi:hypothetical protein